jgi:hypothetical protein
MVVPGLPRILGRSAVNLRRTGIFMRTAGTDRWWTVCMDPQNSYLYDKNYGEPAAAAGQLIIFRQDLQRWERACFHPTPEEIRVKQGILNK